MKLQDLQAALAELTLGLFKGAKVIKTDVREPVVRKGFKIDILPSGGGGACDGARERSVEVDIWYYPVNTARPRDECQEVADALIGALADGFEVDGVWLQPDDNISCDLTSDVLVCQFSTSWVEEKQEDGEPMGELILDI